MTESDEILKLIDKYSYILNKEYTKTTMTTSNIFDKTNELSNILNYKPNTNKRINKIVSKYKKELEGFIYLNNISEIENNKEKLYIKYVGINNKFGYGGFLYKFDKDNIILISQYKKVWNISINNNFIFYRRASTENDKIRDEFEQFLNSTSK